MTGKRGRAGGSDGEEEHWCVMCVQETNWGGNAVRELGEGYKMWYSAKQKNEVESLYHKDRKKTVVEVKELVTG